ncbi:MAG TPA: hypothetical protein VN154_08775, partial [Rhizomicrobium sp.]|nr:hypothetical protein [Rhizomicrobium sp.]
IDEAGYGIERVPSYARWFERFDAKLRALPEEKRQRSILPVIRAFAQPRPAESRPAGSANFVDAVRALPQREVPRLDRELLLKSLKDMQQLGLIPPP